MVMHSLPKDSPTLDSKGVHAGFLQEGVARVGRIAEPSLGGDIAVTQTRRGKDPASIERGTIKPSGATPEYDIARPYETEIGAVEQIIGSILAALPHVA